MSDTESYQDLDVWKVSMSLVEAVYALTGLLPKAEVFGLSAQLRHAAVSIPSNIAEGHGRSHRAEYLHHLSFAKGSLKEVETQLLLAVRLGFVTRDQTAGAWELSQRVGRMLTRLVQSLRQENEKRFPTPDPRPPTPEIRA